MSNETGFWKGNISDWTYYCKCLQKSSWDKVLHTHSNQLDLTQMSPFFYQLPALRYSNRSEDVLLSTSAQTKVPPGLNRWTKQEKKIWETRGIRAKQLFCGVTQCLLWVFQWCQDLGALSAAPYLCKLNYWCVSSDLWASSHGGWGEKVGTWLEVA